MKKLFSALIYVLVAIMTTVSFFGCTPPEEPETPLPSGKIIARENVGYITGPDYFTANDTMKFNIGGTDLGFPLWDSTNERMLVFFGDTFNQHIKTTGDWRSNVVGYTTDLDLSNGLTFDGWLTEDGLRNYTEEQQEAVAVIEGLHNTKKHGETTKIPTGAIEIDGALYMFYFSKWSWDIKVDSMSYGGAVKSTDGGNTWERVYDLTWVNHATGNNSQYGKLNKVGDANSAENIQRIVNQNAAGEDGCGNINIADHEGYFFTQIFPIDGKDGYIYIFGEGGYRTHGIKLGRVLKENFENFSEYEYFCGYDEDNAPIWEKGKEGLEMCCFDNSTFIVGDDQSPMGEHSVAYNPYLKKWVLVYLQNKGGGLMYSLAENIWGPYKDESILMSYSWDQLTSWEDKRITSIYGGFIHEKWMEEDGKVMYCTYSQFNPIYNSSIMKVTFE